MIINLLEHDDDGEQKQNAWKLFESFQYNGINSCKIFKIGDKKFGHDVPSRQLGGSHGLAAITEASLQLLCTRAVEHGFILRRKGVKM